MCSTTRTPLLQVATDDDPVLPGGPRPDWLLNYANSSHAGCAVFPHGTHLVCYDRLDIRTRWVDRLVVQWIDAVTADLQATADSAEQIPSRCHDHGQSTATMANRARRSPARR